MAQRRDRTWFDRIRVLSQLREGLLLLAILAVAAYFRFYLLTTVPAGLLYDEAENGVDILAMLRGARPIFLTANFGREALFIYLQAASVQFFGRTDFALRVVSAVIGTLTIVLIGPFDHPDVWYPRRTPNERLDDGLAVVDHL